MGWQAERGATCGHTDGLPLPAGPGSACADCVRVGGQWVHLRRCLTCDHVACCDSSPHRHATAHAVETGHPVFASAEPREHWAWCHPDQALLLPARSPSSDQVT